MENNEGPIKVYTCEDCGKDVGAVKPIEMGNYKHPDGHWEPIILQCCEWCFPKQSGTVKVNTTGRNEPCPCGSKKKYKKCCGVL